MTAPETAAPDVGDPEVGADATGVVPPPGALVGKRFAAWLAGIAVVAFGIRLWTLRSVADFTPDGGDPFWYHQQANDLVHGRWFTDPFVFQATGEHVPGAQHPPLYTMWLSIASLFGAQSYTSHKVMSCLAGVLAVVLIGLAARAAAGARAGLLAAGLAAVYPPLWVIDGLLWPEGLFAAMIALTVLFAFRWRRSPTLLEAAGLGVAIALATLTRGEAVGLLVVLALPLIVLRPALTWRLRLTHLVAVGLAFLVLVAPWSIRNLVSYERFMPLSTNTDEIFVYANNPYAYGTADRQYVCTPEQSRYESTPNGMTLEATGSTYLGFWYFPWEVYQRCIGGEPPGDVSQKSAYWRQVGLDYAKDHLDRFPVVAAARVGRVWDVWRPFQNAFFLKTEGRNQTVSNYGVWSWWAAALLAIYGAVVLRRRGQTILPFVSLAIMITVTAIYGYGTDRFRVPMDVAALILAGAAVDALLRAWRSRATATSTDAQVPDPALSACADPARGAPSPAPTFGTIARMPGPAPAPTAAGRAPRSPDPVAGSAAAPPDRRRPWVTVAIGAVAVVPILVLIAVLAARTWYPTGDIAQAELRMRSLLSDPPLVGAAGRIADDAGRQGNHPGPLMFWVTWPIYWLLGRSAWAFEAATAIVNVAWLCVTVWLARRRGGTPVAWWAAVVLVLLLGGYGLDGVSQPWNPWTSLLPFSALLFAVWSVLDGDRWMLPVAVFAGSYALQGHIGYLALVPPLLLLAVASLVWQWWTTRRHATGAHSRPTVSTTARRPGWVLVPLGAGVLAGLLAWAGPIADVLTRTPSNVAKLYENFGHPDTPPLGLWRGLGALLRGLNPVGAWLVGGQEVSGSVVPGALLVLAWALAAVVVWRRGEHAMTRLNLVLAVALVLGLASTSRIFGDLYFYVYRWVCPLAGALVFSLGWSLVTLAPERWRSRVDRRWLPAAAAAVLLVVVAVTTVRLATGPTPYLYASRIEAELSPQLADLPKDRRYLIRWDDPVYLGGLGFGVLLDLERQGYDVGVDPQYATGAEPHRVLCPGDYDAVVTVVTSPSRIAKWRATPGAREVATADPRTAEERAASERDRAVLAAYLESQGKPSDQADVDTALTSFVLSTALPRAVNDAAGRLISTSVPSAVFLTDPAPEAAPVAHLPTTEACWRDQ